MDELVSVSLQGGPPSLPRSVRVERSKLRDGKIKIEHLGGYEHFERTDGVQNSNERPAEVYAWTLRTKIAE
jgi:Family of unknown function (DUF5988)